MKIYRICGKNSRGKKILKINKRAEREKKKGKGEEDEGRRIKISTDGHFIMLECVCKRILDEAHMEP